MLKNRTLTRNTKRHRILSPLIVTACSAGLFLSTPAMAATFSDVPNQHWAYSYIESLASKGIANGYNGQYSPEAPITRAEFAKLLVKSLNLPSYRPANPTFTDVSPASWEYEYVETAYKKGLLNGVEDHRFDPTLPITRQDMTKMLVNGLPVALADIRTDIQSNLTFQDRNTIADYAKPYVGVGTYLELINGQPGNLFAPTDTATRAEAAAVVDRFLKVPQDKLTSLTTYPAATLIAMPVQSAFTAGSSAIISFQVQNQHGEIMQDDNGRKVTVTISQPILRQPADNYTPKKFSLDTTTHNGVATFSIPVTKAGLYRVEVTSNGLAAVKESTFNVVPAQAEKLYLSASPSPFLLPGTSVTLTAKAVDHYNNAVTNVSGLPVTVSMVGTSGILEKATTTLTNGVATLGNFKAGTIPGDVTLTASVGNNSLAADTFTLTVMKDKTDLVAGKGVWMMWRDWYYQDNAYIIAEAKKKGITHLYLQVATSTDGIYGEDALDDFLQEAHRNHIKVIGWVYSSLRNPSQDATRDIQVVKYQTPSGDRVDALATDIEDAIGTTEANVNTYSGAVRASLGQSYPFFAVTYPPSMRPNYPWKSFGTYYDVIIPMDYWHVRQRSYSQQEAADFVTQSIADIRRLTGKPNMPISIAGQGYDAFSESAGANNPQPQEVLGAITGAKSAGAVGFSMYRWGTMTQGQWDTFGTFNW